MKKSIKINFTDFSKAVGKGGIDVLFGKWDSLAGNAVDVLSALGLAANAKEIAWLLIYRSLLQAMKNLIDEKTELDPNHINIKALHQEINQALATSSLTLNHNFFKHPDKDPIIAAIKPTFVSWLKQCQVSEADAIAISDRLPIYFAAALHHEWGNQAKDYAVLKERLDTPFTQANQRIQAWFKYETWLQKQVEEPMFLEAFSLKRVYVPLRAYYKRKVEGQNPEELDPRLASRDKFERVVIELDKELKTWLNQAKKDDAIRLISGSPGSGKSSFAKMFAANLAETDKIPVLLIPLHHFNPADDLIDAVGKFVHTDGILHNPLAADCRESRLLIIFDGLDELAMQGKIAEKIAQDFVREVQRTVDRLNQRELCLQVLIAGRELAMQANETDFRKEGQILHVLPYFIPENKRKNYVDENQLLEQDQRQNWWQNYGTVSGYGYTGLPNELDQGNLTEITAQPLLNYLVALSLRRGKLTFSKDTNLNAIYNDLLKAIYERGWAGHQHRAIQGIEERDFIRILEEIALAAWHGNGRTTTVRDIENHCDNSNLKNLLKRFQEGFQDDAKASITRLMTAFYFRQSGHNDSGDKTFEFTHKSFGEYLTARRIVQEVRYIHCKLEARDDDPYEDWDERRALHRWALVCGSTAMDEYLFQFVLDEMRLHYQKKPEDVAKWQDTLCDLISFMLKHGMPMERLEPRPNFQEENRQARNAEEALLAVLNSCARLTEKLSEIKWHSEDAFGNWISRLHGQRIDKDVFCLSCLSFLDLRGCVLVFKDFYWANFEGANFEGANLEEANLKRANLFEANLFEANLFEANFEGANLERANLKRANLEGANLEEANLKGANLEEANLEEANFEGANLKRATLFEANLEWANLKRANLFEANLFDANFEGANLEGAHLKGANLKRANLKRANLKRANLFEANFEGANFEGATLEWANLFEANLKGTILEGKVPISSPETEQTL
ncbi:Pentapeptide repeat protein [Coleofasciculus chthonoplastes PCC 7420]|uniref:Pentapeptide repeat protein n=1 Tax=Coleofasciculus chthonoplastes PCC 7420 TaxID=118168 RepID=B4VVM7_9CYAN|nr:Pentapeptide repeat protein [Coleofasciculus chthonoplastes PCC 7420]